MIAAGAWYYFNQPTKPSKPAAATLVSPPAIAPPTSSKPALPEPPFGISEDVFESGARLYTARCAVCHGNPTRQAPLAASLNPAPLQLWIKHPKSAAIGVSAQAPGEIYLHTRDGIPRTGMPAFKRQLSDTQIWQLTLLLKSADQPLPDPVRTLLAAQPPAKPNASTSLAPYKSANW